MAIDLLSLYEPKQTDFSGDVPTSEETTPSNIGMDAAKVEPDYGLLERAIKAVELPGGLVREGILQAFDPDVQHDLSKFGDLLTGKHRRSADSFLKEIGVDDPGFMTTLAVDFMTDPVTFIPLIGGFGKAASSSVGKFALKKMIGNKAAQLAAKSAMGVSKYSGAETLQRLAAKAYLGAAAKGVGGAMIGAGAGAASTLPGEDAIDVARNTLIGAGLGLVGEKGVKGAGAALKYMASGFNPKTPLIVKKAGQVVENAWDKIGGTKVFDNLSDEYYAYTRSENLSALKEASRKAAEVKARDAGLSAAKVKEAGEAAVKKIPTFSEAHKIMKDFENTHLPHRIAQTVRRAELFTKASEELGEQGFKQYDDMIKLGQDSFTTHRNELRANFTADLKQAEKAGDIKFANKAERKEYIREREDMFTDEANKFSRSEVGKFIKESGNPALKKHADNYINHSRRAIDELNTVQATNKLGPDASDWAIKDHKDQFGMHGMDFYRAENHIPKELDIRSYIAEGNPGFKKRMKEESLDLDNYSIKDRAKISGELYTRMFENDMTRKSRQVLAIMGDKPRAAGARGLENILSAYDGFTNGLKTMHLNGNYTWLMNNYVDSVSKVWARHGLTEALGAAWDLAPHQIWKKEGTLGKMFNMMDANKDTMVQSLGKKELDLAHHFGVISPGMMEEIAVQKMTHAQRILQFGEERADEIAASLGELKHLKKPFKNLMDGLRNTVGRYGSAMEGTVRSIDFSNNLSKLAELHPELKKVLKGNTQTLIKRARLDPKIKQLVEKARQMTNETFIDYRGTSLGEEKILKRIMPYYTFFARNVPYWMKQAVEQPSRVAALTKIHGSRGNAPTSDERKTMPDYLLNAGARVKKHNDDGSLDVASQSGFSAFEAVNVLDSVLNPATLGMDTTLSKINPIVKAGYEQFTNTDTFANTPLEPEKYATGGIKPKYVAPSAGEKVFEAFGAVVTDEKGNPKTSSPTVARLLNLKSSLLPFPALDTIARVGHNVAQRDRSLLDEIQNLGNLKTKTVTKGSREWTLQKRIEKARKERGEMEKKRPKMKRLRRPRPSLVDRLSNTGEY